MTWVVLPFAFALPSAVRPARGQKKPARRRRLPISDRPFCPPPSDLHRLFLFPLVTLPTFTNTRQHVR
jgi:hypothetical protein